MTDLEKSPNTNANLHFQCFYCLPNNLLANTQCFHSSLLHLFQFTRCSNIRIGRVSGTKLTNTHGGPTAFRVFCWSWVAACPSSKDCGFARCESRRRHEKNELETRCGRNSGRHFVARIDFQLEAILHRVVMRILFEKQRMKRSPCVYAIELGLRDKCGWQTWYFCNRQLKIKAW